MSVGGFVLISVIIVLEIGHLKKTDEPKSRRRKRSKSYCACRGRRGSEGEMFVMDGESWGEWNLRCKCCVGAS